MPDRWKTFPIVCRGGLDLFTDALTKGIQQPGFATRLQNYEPSVEGGYQRLLGSTKFDTNIVPGDTNQPVTGVGVAFSGVYAVRKSAAASNDVYFSSGSGWGAALNAGARNGSVSKSRFHRYSINGRAVVLTDGVNPAWKHNGSVETVINGAGAPSAPKYAATINSRLVLAPASTSTSFALSAPNTDTDFTGAAGAIEISVGDVINGLQTFRDQLYILCESSIWRLVGSTSADYTVVPVSRSIGCIAPDSIQEVGGDVMFLASDGLRSIAATERNNDLELGVLSKRIQPTLRPIISAFSPNDFSSCIIRGKSQYRLFWYNNNLADGDQAGVLGKLEMRSAEGMDYAWATTKGFPVYCCDSAYDGETERAVYGHPTDGYVYRLESGNSINGAAIEAIYRTPDIMFDDPEMRKVLFKLKIFAQVQGDSSATLNLLYDGERNGVLQPSSQNVSFSGGSATYGSAIYGTSVYSEIGNPVLDFNLVGSGMTAAIQFTSTNTQSIHRIDSMTLEYSLQGRR